MSKSGKNRIGLWATALLFGAFTMLAQVLLLRAMLSSLEENEILLALFYGSWFFGIFLGAAAARAFGRHAILLVLQAALLPVALISIRTIHATLGLPAAEPVPFGRLEPIVLIHAGPMGFLTGLIFPLLCRMDGTLAAPGAAPDSLARIYGWESLGACASGAALTFLLAGRVPSTRWR